MRRSLGLAAALFLSSVPAWSQPAANDFLKEQGARYGLSSAPEGLIYKKRGVDGKLQERQLSALTAERLTALMTGVPKDKVDGVMASALESYLSTRGAIDPKLLALLFEVGPDGKKRLTQMGRNVLMDILTAEDGLTFGAPVEKPSTARERKVSALRVLRAMEQAGVLVLGKLAGTELGAAKFSASFDGSVRQGVYGLDAFDWNTGGDPVLIRKAREKDSLYLQSVPGATGSRAPPESETLRVMIAAKRPVDIDRFKVEGDGDAVLAEAGLDAGLFRRNGARVVRAVDNLVAVDVPLANARELGMGLEKSGVASRPARAFRMAVDAVKRGPSWPDPLHGVLPWSAGARGSDAQPLNAGSEDVLKVGAMAAKGMDGAGSVVAVVDSGLDVTHPDFEDRVAAYIDLTDSGTKDFVGHGTHVAGSVGGSGAGAGGKFKGMAPKTKFVILKVFGQEGSASEDTIIAAMKAARSLPKEIRPDVMNLSLGGPGDPETDPLAVLANEMMLKDNIVMAVAAGNSGPSRKTIGAPGNARHVLTVTGTNKQKTFPFFPSRGPVTTSKGKTYNKPDISAIAGDVSASQRLRHWFNQVTGRESVSAPEDPADPGCFYAPGGVISPKSKDDGDAGCALKGHPGYRYMSGTSMATPLVAGIAADTVGYLKANGKTYKATEIKALIMETADSLGQKPEVQGAGLVNGEKLAKALEQRVKQGLPVGNVAYSVAHRLSAWDAYNMALDKRFERTQLGILDKQTGHLISTDAEFEQVVGKMDSEFKAKSLPARLWRRVTFWWES